MTEPASGSVTTPSIVLSLSGFWGAKLFGLPVETIILVTGVIILGAIGRLGFEIAKQSESDKGIQWGKIAALFGGSLISAPTLAVGYLSALSSAGIQNDGATLFGSLVIGITGPKALLWVYSLGSAAFKKRTGMDLPAFDNPPPAVK